MIDIQIEDSLVKESLMSIDVSNCKTHLLDFGGFAIILLLMMFLGIYGPPAIMSHSVTQPLADILSLEAKNITPNFRFLDYDMVFIRANDEKSYEKIGFNANLQYSIYAFDEDGKLNHQFQMKLENKPVTIPIGEPKSSKIRIYRDRIIDFSSINFEIQVLNSNYIMTKYGQNRLNVTVNVRYGSKEHTLFQIYFRFLFILFIGFFLISILRHLFVNPVKYWHLEQKLTVPLLALSILYNDPFYIFQAKSPTYAYILWHTIATSVFVSYFQFFILALFDSLRYKNRKTDQCFFIPKIAYCLILFLSSVTHGIYDDISSFHGATSENFDDVESVLRWLQIFLNIGYFFWAVSSIVLAGIQIDVTERYKFIMYTVAGGTSIFVLAIVHVLFSALSLFQNSAIHFVMTFSVQNAFVLMMLLFHWPYDLAEEQNYNDAIEPKEFFAPGDLPENVE